MNAFEAIERWIDEFFGDRQMVMLIVALVVLFLFIWWLGWYVAPVLAGLCLAFIMHGPVDRLVRWRVPELVAILIAMLVMVGVLVALLFWVVPLVVRQANAAVQGLTDAPERLNDVWESVDRMLETVLAPVRDMLPDLFPVGVSASEFLQSNLQTLLEAVPGFLLETLPGLLLVQAPNMLTLVLYAVLVPVCTFFFLKDRASLLTWFGSHMPRNRATLERVGREMQVQLGNYIRGKFVEVLIVGTATFLTFQILGLENTVLLAALVGLSVLIPLVGAIVVTVPVVLVALIQFGWSADFLYVVVAYFVIQGLDGNVLVPLLFSEVVDLHPVGIITAVLVFGGIWGFWGLLFAIPLAVLVRVVLQEWRSSKREAEAAETG